jgi:hypothetical protein
MENPRKDFFLKNLKWYEHLAAGWPLILMFLGGAVGGGCGGLAYALNGKIFNSKLSTHLKYIFSFLIGIGAILLYILVVIILFQLFPGLARYRK